MQYKKQMRNLEIFVSKEISKSTVNETIKSPFSSLTNFMSCSCTYCIEWSTVYSHIEFSLTADYINKTFRENAAQSS